MSSYHSTTSSSISSSSISNEWSFGSTNSSNNYDYYNNNNTNNTTTSKCGEIIPYISPQHYFHYITTLKTPNHHHITCMAVHNNLLYAACGDKINVFDLTTFSHVVDHALSLNNQELSSCGFIKSILFYNNNDNVLTAHQDNKIRAWKRHRFVATLPTLRDKICRFAWAKNYVQVRRNKKKLWIQHNDAVSGLAWSESNKVIYSVSWDKSLKIWRKSDFKCLESVTAHDDAINAVTVSVDGRVYTGSTDGKVKVWKMDNKVGRHIMVDSMEMQTSVNLTGKIIESDTLNLGLIHISVKICTYDSLYTEKKKTGVNALALSRDGRVLISGGCDGLIMVWKKDDENDRMVESEVLEGHFGAVLCLIRLDYECNYVDNYDLFVSGSADKTVRIWGGVHGGVFRCLGVLEGHKKAVRSVAVAVPESGVNGVVWVCSGSLDGEIKIWQVMVSELVNNM